MSVRIEVLCSECSYSKSAVCADAVKVCSNCGAAWPRATDAQRKTVDYFSGVCRENGSKLHAELDCGTVWMTETASPEWDSEVTRWTVAPDGNAVIL